MRPKRRMQNVNFRNVDEMLDSLPEDELAITLRLRELVLETIPNVTERLAYNVPFYRRHANICFIWPGSIAWGSKTQPGVRFGFTNGHLLQDDISFLDKGKRKQVYWRDFFGLGDIDAEILVAYISSAAEIDAESWEKKQHHR